ncbi:hemagglutinin repeat-containing protein, partial [Escherichia coli]
NAIQAGERRRYGGSGWYETHAVAPTVTAGNSLMLSAGRDVNSQAAGITAENSMDIRAGRDVNMAAESTGAGDHDSTFSMKTVHDSVRQQGTDMTSGGDITVTAGRDITSVATAVTAKGDIRVNAGHDIVLGTATESDYHYSESGETRNRLLSHQTTRTITEDSVTREKGSLLSGNRVTVNAGDNLTVEGSDVVAERDVSLAAGNHVDVLAATSTDTSWRFKETKKSGLTGTGGIGFTIGSSKTSHDRREAGTTQSQSASTIGSTAGNVSITAGKHALIYAGNNLKLFTDRLHNQHGDILADNSLWVQKDSSGTANSEIINRSGNIETTRGDITMNTAHLLNSWDAISASHEVIPGSSHGVISPVPENNRWWGVVRHDGVEYLAVYWGKGATVPDEYRIRTGDTDTVTVSASGYAARISGGADMHIRAGRLDNEASFILAGSSMTLSGDTLNNQGWQEGTTGKETVWRLASGSLPKAWFTEPWYKVYRQVSPDVTEASGTSPAGQYRAVISAAGDVSASFATDTGNTTVMPRAGGAGNTITVPSLNSLTPPTVSQGVSGEALLNESGTGITGPVWNDALPDTLKDIPGALSLSGASVSSYPLPSGNNGYFVPSTAPDSPYLITVNPKLDGLGKVDSSLFAGLYDLLRMQPGQAPRETDPAYTDEKQFLGSSYILDRLGLKPEKDYRFLGDAAFDTRYVSNVILNQTGSRYINGTGSDLAQMKYLMDSAAAQQKALGLTFGVSLTAGQVAQLTRSILWWESVTINGQTVMVPKLYLSPEDITLHNGSVISGNNVQLAGGNITNSGGSINAQNDLLLDSTGSIDNLNAGLISAGGSLDLSAIGDIGNISSVISGKTVSLESATGNISNLTRTEQWAMNNGYNHFSGTDTGPLAAVRATDSLFMGAAGDISITGAAVSAGDSVLLSAGNDLN